MHQFCYSEIQNVQRFFAVTAARIAGADRTDVRAFSRCVDTESAQGDVLIQRYESFMVAMT